MTKTITPALTMTIGRRRYQVASLAAASEMFCIARDKAATGSSRTPTPLLHDAAGKLVGYVSYNGRIWAGHPHDWTPEAVPLFDAIAN